MCGERRERSWVVVGAPGVHGQTDEYVSVVAVAPDGGALTIVKRGARDFSNEAWATLHASRDSLPASEDVDAVARAAEDTGASVVCKDAECSAEAFLEAIDSALSERAGTARALCVYTSAHGVVLDGRRYLLLVDGLVDVAALERVLATAPSFCDTLRETTLLLHSSLVGAPPLEDDVVRAMHAARRMHVTVAAVPRGASAHESTFRKLLCGALKEPTCVSVHAVVEHMRAHGNMDALAPVERVVTSEDTRWLGMAKCVPMLAPGGDAEKDEFARLRGDARLLLDGLVRDHAEYGLALQQINPERAIQQGLDRLGDVLQQPSPRPSPRPDICREGTCVVVGVPARRPFEGRPHELGDVLARLAPAAAGDGATRTAIVQHTGVVGLGGIGKTALAIEAVHRVLDERRFPLVVWCNAATLRELDASLAAVADEDDVVEVSRRTGESDAETARRVLTLLQKTDQRWLLVLDNADTVDGTSLADIKQRVPGRGHGCVLVTSRHDDLGELCPDIRMLRLSALPADEAVVLAARLSGEDARARANNDSAEAAARRRVAVDVLGGLPLAIEQAAAFVRRGRSSFAAWAERFARERTALFGHERALAFNTRETVHTTWRTNMALLCERTGATAEACKRVMRVLAVCAPDAIPRVVVAALCRPNDDDTADADADVVDDVLAALSAHSLVQRDADAQSVVMHPIVQAVVRDSAGLAGEVEEVRVDAATLLFRLWPAWGEIMVDPDRRTVAYALLPHGMHVLDACTSETEVVLDLAVRCADTLQLKGSHTEAARMRRRLIALRAAVQGEAADEDTLHHQMILGQELRAVEQYEESEKVLRGTLDTMRRVLGEEHEKTLRCMQMLALTMGLRGDDYEGAERLAREAVETLTRVAGEAAGSTLDAMQSLASVLKERGELDAAEAMQRRVLEGTQQLHGLDHPWTLGALNNLAAMLSARHQHEEAERISRRVVMNMRRVLGDDHPKTNDAWFSLAGVLAARGKSGEARGLLQRLLHLSPELRSAHTTVPRMRKMLARVEL